MRTSTPSVRASGTAGSLPAGLRGRRRFARAAAAALLEPLEVRQLLSVTITGQVTLDESPGLQNTNVPVTGEDNNDSDVALSSLPSTFYHRLFDAPPPGLALSTTFPTQIGVGKSPDNFITVTTAGTVVNLGFTKADGTALPVLGSGGTGVDSTLSALNGGAISLFADSVLGSRMAVGVDTAGDKVLALFLDPNATLTSAKVWTVQFEPLSNPDKTNPDDPVTLGNLGVAASISTEFDFSALPSGQNLFGTVGTATTAMIVIGAKPVLHPDGTYTNTSDTINTSQGGGPTTIGVNNQMFDGNTDPALRDGAYFTYVTNPDPLPGTLTQTQADDAHNIKYDSTIAASGGFLKISQSQGSAGRSMQLSAFDLADAPQKLAYVDAVTGKTSGARTAVNITQVKQNGVVVFSGSALSVVIDNINAGDKIEWTTASPHDTVLVEAVAGKFDIGGFGITQPSSDIAPLTGVRFEDDGPTIGPIANSIVDFVKDATVTKTLNGVVGIDPNSAPYTIDNFTPSLTVNGVLLTGVLATNKQSVTYFADTSKDGTFGNTGDTAYYRLTLNETDGTYTFDVLVSPPPAEITFNFSDLPSGQNLFGMIGDPATGLIVVGAKPDLNADTSYTNASNTINTSKGGGATTIGVDNQMFDPTDGAYFTFVKNPDTRFLGVNLSSTEADYAKNILYTGGTSGTTSAFLNVVQSQGSAGRSMRLSAFDLADAPQGVAYVDAVTGKTSGARTAVNITQVKQNGIVVFSGSALSVVIDNINAGDKIEWTTDGDHDTVLVEGVTGKFDIGGFGITQSAPTPDQKLDFVVKVTDGDGDSNTAGFSIGIDGTGIYHDGKVDGVTVSSASSLSVAATDLTVSRPTSLLSSPPADWTPLTDPLV